MSNGSEFDINGLNQTDFVINGLDLIEFVHVINVPHNTESKINGTNHWQAITLLTDSVKMILKNNRL